MQVGDLVKYKQQYETDGIGIIIDTQALGMRMLVEWNNGSRGWRHINVLEAICK
tara:strand:+ start:93 stop:254 length:162 start_codon:yes stop_codon:yes gene_type:complete